MMSLVAIMVTDYGIEKDSQVAPLKAKNEYAEREAGRSQTDLVVVATKINGTAIYTSVDQNPNLLNLHLTVKNNGSIVLDPREYSIILNRTWMPISSTSNNVTPPLNKSNTSSLNLTVTPESKPMQSISLLINSGNGVKIITPTSPIINETQLDVQVNNTQPEQGCWFDLNISWAPSFGEMWPISHYTLYYMTDDTPAARVDKNDVDIAFTTSSTTNFFIGRAFRTSKVGQCGSQTGNQSVFMWVSATDVHGNEGPPSNTCYSRGSGSGNTNCNRA